MGNESGNSPCPAAQQAVSLDTSRPRAQLVGCLYRPLGNLSIQHAEALDCQLTRITNVSLTGSLSHGASGIVEPENEW